jgi:ADP-heptose:LPS heptosyltransferase
MSKRYGVVRTDRLGDVILTLPTASALKRAEPDAEVVFVVRRYAAPLLRGNPFVDRVVVLEELFENAGFGERVRRIRALRLDVVFLVYPRFALAAAFRLAGVPVRVGSGYRWYSFLFNRKVYEHRKDAKRHELEYNLGLLERVGVSAESGFDNVEFGLRPVPEAVESVRRILAERGVKENEALVALHPGSGGSAADLPIEKFATLARRVAASLRARVVVTGSEGERPLAARLAETSNRAIDLAGALSLTELVALIDRCAVFVANSTGPLHIAAAVGTPVVGFYPTFAAASKERWGPYSSQRAVLEPTSRSEGDERDMASVDLDAAFVEIEKFYKLSEFHSDENSPRQTGLSE